MAYVEEHLIAGENVVYQTKLRWYVYGWAALTIVFAVLIFVGGSADWGAVVLFLSFALGAAAWVKRANSEFAITNKRIVVKLGVLTTRSLELNLQKVEGIAVEQDLTGQMFGYGTIVVTGTGGTREPFDGIEDPHEFRRKAQEQIAGVQPSQQARPPDGGFCPLCGRPVMAGSSFCAGCGKPIGEHR